MSKAFLNQILRIENSVQSGEGNSCYICFQEYGTLCPESGVIEVAVRLPCQHAMGSACIAKWLHTNNTCPICREIFFFLERKDTDDEDLTPSETEFGEEGGEDLQVSARNSCIVLCARLHISTPIATLAEWITAKGESLDLFFMSFITDSAAAACIYIATHLMEEPRTLEEITSTANISAISTYNAYSRLYDNRRELFEDLVPGNLIALLPDLSAAAMEYGVQEGLEALAESMGVSRADV